MKRWLKDPPKDYIVSVSIKLGKLLPALYNYAGATVKGFKITNMKTETVAISVLTNLHKIFSSRTACREPMYLEVVSTYFK